MVLPILCVTYRLLPSNFSVVEETFAPLLIFIYTTVLAFVTISAVQKSVIDRLPGDIEFLHIKTSSLEATGIYFSEAYFIASFPFAALYSLDL